MRGPAKGSGRKEKTMDPNRQNQVPMPTKKHVAAKTGKTTTERGLKHKKGY